MSHPPRALITTCTSVLLAGTMCLAACGSDDTTTPPTIPDDIVLDGDPSPLFGASPDDSDGAADEASDVAPVSTVNPCPPDVDPMDPVCQGIPDVVMPIDTFVPATEDVAFCDVLADIDSRPRPTDEFDELRITQVWLAELDAVVPDAIADDLGVLVDFVDTTVGAGATGLDDVEIDPSVDVAADAIGEYVSAACPSS